MQLARVIPREVVMTSSLFAATRRLGRAEGRKEGAEMAFRRSLSAILRRRHPDLATRMAAVVERCNDVVQLERWVVAASELSSDELLKLMLPGASTKATRTARGSARPLARKRAARPTRRSLKKVSGR